MPEIVDLYMATQDHLSSGAVTLRRLGTSALGQCLCRACPTWSNFSVILCMMILPWLLWHSSVVTIERPLSQLTHVLFRSMLVNFQIFGKFPAITLSLASFLSFFFSPCFLGPNPRPMKVPKLGVKLGPQLPAYATATATSDPSHICDLHHSSQQYRILNPLSEARD